MALLCQGNASHACCVYIGGMLPEQQLQPDTMGPAELAIDAGWLTAQSYQAAGKTCPKQLCLHDMLLTFNTSQNAMLFAISQARPFVSADSSVARQRQFQPAPSRGALDNCVEEKGELCMPCNC